MDLSYADVQQRAGADRREVDPPIQVEAATLSSAGQLDWWVKDRQEWWGRVRGANGRQRWIRAGDLRPANSWPETANRDFGDRRSMFPTV
jgi:hypothetical protein